MDKLLTYYLGKDVCAIIMKEYRQNDYEEWEWKINSMHDGFRKYVYMSAYTPNMMGYDSKQFYSSSVFYDGHYKHMYFSTCAEYYFKNIFSRSTYDGRAFNLCNGIRSEIRRHKEWKK